MTIIESLKEVCQFCSEHLGKNLKTKSEEAQKILKTFDDYLIVPFRDKKVVPPDWKIERAKGPGNFPQVPWISFLPPGQKTSDGIYVVICFGKTGNGIVVGCAVSRSKPEEGKKVFITEEIHQYLKPQLKERKTRKKHPEIDVDGGNQNTKYNNVFFNPAEYLKDVFDEETLIKKLQDSVKVCEEELKMVKEAFPENSSVNENPSASVGDTEVVPDNNTESLPFKLPELLSAFRAAVKEAGLQYEDSLVNRFVAALCAKPFVILTGLSGSGKTKLAQAFVEWMAPDPSHSLLVPVGADWTNNEKLLGYPNALDKDSYVMPDTGVLKLMLAASTNEQDRESKCLPYFLILDEMNLSHVERYFADFLSAMESGDEIKLYGGDQRYADEAKTIAVPRRIRVPKNLVVIGTMNVDETTYMFSPKVLDRAQVIEFRVKPEEMAKFVGYDNNGTWQGGTAAEVHRENLVDSEGIGKGAQYDESFLKQTLGRGEKKPSDAAIPAAPTGQPVNPDAGKIPLQEVAKAVNAFFRPLAKLGAEFGYRSASEIMSFCGFYIDAGASIDEAIDAAIVQKLLPKVHGSRRKLEGVLSEIWKLCLNQGVNDQLDAVAKADVDYEFTKNKYPLSAEKVLRMFRAAMANGFASFAEA